MPPRHHVLLIGIDAYDGGGSLGGCVNDIDAIQRALIGKVGVAPERIARLASPRFEAVHETVVPSRLPTLQAMHEELARLAAPGVVERGDHVFIYYSGHGTQVITTSETGGRFSREALLPKDKDDGFDGRFLFDWEINKYLVDIAAVTPRLTVVLDCCSAGGATRGDLADPEPTAPLDRFHPTVKPFRMKGAPPTPRRGLAAATSGLSTSQVVMACRDDERARESATAEGEPAHGELTRALIAELQRYDETQVQTLRWGQVWRGVEASIAKVNPRQHPWITGGFGRQVFGFAGDDGDPGYAVVQVPGGYQLDVGVRHGVTRGAQVGVYGAVPPGFPPIGSGEDKDARQGMVTVQEAGDASSFAVAEHAFGFPDPARGRLIEPGLDARIRVRLDPMDETLVARLKGSPFVELVTESADVELARRADGSWGLGDDIHHPLGKPPAPELVVIPADRVDVIPAVLEHYHAYVAPVRLARTCRDLPGQLNLWLLRCDGRVPPAQAQDPVLPRVEPGEHAPNVVPHGAEVCVVVENTAEVKLVVHLFDCAPSGKVLFLGKKDLPRRSKHAFWMHADLGLPFSVSVPAGRTVGIDRLVAIGTTDLAANLEHMQRTTSFADLLDLMRGGTRSIDGARRPPPLWTSAMTVLRVER
jgi:hypothetical protein